ncbi:DUF2382 domain-containing protein [Streptomyces sp. NP160]|uniref:PRC and DUF2382 domain-containing protein n=1 Tax=Streptomyces sp. NP160 TaxID=2586637 RepID=UPI0011192084|nr:PRC and DUF2382 domain-containing protein [Streptomyces sp. NP160]TNM67361.1 DUF2382 domain-containing protein [Streptomyces sp. NP160]
MPIDSSTSIDALRAATVTSADGSKIGKVAEVYLDDHSDQPEWVTVKTGLFGSSETFVPLSTASYLGDEIRVPYTKEQVKDAPRTDADGTLSPQEEERLYEHYSLGGSGAQDLQAGTTTTTATGRLGEWSDSRDDDASGRAGGRDTQGTRGTVGHDTSGPTTDDAMTRSEERLHVGTQVRESGRARLRKHVVTEEQTRQVATSHEELVVTREPITEANRGAATAGPELSEEEHEVVLHEEVPVVSKHVEAVERVRLGTRTEQDTQTVSADVRKEEIDLDADSAVTTGSGEGDRHHSRHA